MKEVYEIGKYYGPYLMTSKGLDVAHPRYNTIDQWEDIPDTYDKPKLCRIEDPTCTACE